MPRNYKNEAFKVSPLELKHHKNLNAMGSATTIRHHLTLFYCSCFAITITILINHNVHLLASAISIKPADFDHLIMPCYLGGSSSSSAYSSSSSAQSLAQNPNSSPNLNIPSSGGYSGQAPRRPDGNWQTIPSAGSNGNGGGGGGSQPPYYAAPPDSGRQNGQAGLSYLGQQIPRANTIDNFIALVSKIETANPRLANNPDQLIKVLLGRFRMDNYYYDIQTRTPIIDQDHRTLNIIPAILDPMGQGQQQQFMLASDIFPEHLLDRDEKCSMYFMLSHFIEKSSSLSSPPLIGAPVPQLIGPLGGQRPPNLQAAGSGYPALSANAAFNGGSRFPGPSPSFGSPATKNMNSFGSGISNNPEYTGNNPYGMNVPQPNPQFNQNYNNVRNTGQYSGTLSSNNKYSTPLIDGNVRGREERQATEYGVVAAGSQENAAIVLNRVLMGILAAATPPQTIRQLASIIYPTQPLTSSPKIDEEIDPLFAVTLADLWAVSSIAKSGKAFDFRMLGDNGRWNNTMCPTSFHLERANSIRFTTAELIGGLDGFSLGMFRRRLLSMRKNMRLSEMLRMYYSKTGFRPQFAEVGVCNRATVINTQLDDLHRQAENYLRLYQLNLPISDNEVAISINRLESFKETSRQAANQYGPPEICQDSSSNDAYPMSQQDQCEIAKADVVTVLDTSPQANDAFMQLVVTKLAQKLGLSRQSNSFSVLTNQQDTSGYAGAYSFNAIVRNSTNTAEIGCSLVYDTSKSYQGGQVTDPTRIIEMFERALVNIDSEYLVRQSQSPTSTYRSQSYVSSFFGQSENAFSANGAGPKNTGGAKVIIWFNYGSQIKPASVGSYPTNWNGPNYFEQNNWKFDEAKNYLRENYRGAAILAIAANRDDVKKFVYDEERDILTDIPPGDSGASLSSSSDYPYQPASDPSAIATLNGPADQLVNKLVQRMCDIPAVFQYPMCFRAPSDSVVSLGYISPGRRQNWMMSPKTFFASRTVRMAFKVEGGKLRVCFGRMPRPDESAQKGGQNYQSGGISFASNPQGSGPLMPTTSTSSYGNNYNTGSENGICKDVSPGQEVDFIVDDPCYKRSIAECEPFYYVIKEISNPGEGDPNYMCKDEGCKRFDQAKFVMTHTGVVCSSAFETLKANWFLITISITTALALNSEFKLPSQNSLLSANKGLYTAVAVVCGSICLIAQQVQAQQAGVNDFGAGRSGEKRGNLTPSETLAITLLVMTILAGLALTIGLCYYISKRNSKGMERVQQDDY